MNSEQDSPLLLTVAQVERLISYRRSKIYTLMREKDHPFPAQACRGRWRRAATSSAGSPNWAKGARREPGVGPGLGIPGKTQRQPPSRCPNRHPAQAAESWPGDCPAVSSG